MNMIFYLTFHNKYFIFKKRFVVYYYYNFFFRDVEVCQNFLPCFMVCKVKKFVKHWSRLKLIILANESHNNN
jgi:hypothetical protein